MQQIEVRIGQLFEVRNQNENPEIHVVYRLPEENPARTFSSWYVRKGQDGKWEMYGFPGTQLPKFVSKWLPERLTLEQLSLAAERDGDFTPDIRRKLMQQLQSNYDRVSLIQIS
jgi:hypothetical protein